MKQALPFNKLVFSGGGVWGVAYGGAAKALDEAGVFSKIEQVAGTSAGSIAALLTALKYTPTELRKIIANTPFASFAEDPQILDFLDTYGLFSSQPVAKWLTAQIQSAGANFNPPQSWTGDETFTDLAKVSDIGLRIFTTDLNTRSTVELSVAKTPTVRLVDAVRSSMSIPAFFQTFQFPGGVPNADSYVDGGVILDYAIDTYDGEGSPDEVLGLHLGELGITLPRTPLGKDDITTWVSLLYDALRRSQDEAVLANPADLKRTVQIPAAAIASAFNFFLDAEQVAALEASGYAATKKFLANWEG